jgi:hypothetical protein
MINHHGIKGYAQKDEIRIKHQASSIKHQASSLVF